MALLFSHKVYPDLPKSAEGLLYETFTLRDLAVPSKELTYVLTTMTLAMIRPTREMDKAFTSVLRYMAEYREASIISTHKPTLANRHKTMRLFFKMSAMLNGEGDPATTPYDPGK